MAVACVSSKHDRRRGLTEVLKCVSRLQAPAVMQQLQVVFLRYSSVSEVIFAKCHFLYADIFIPLLMVHGASVRISNLIVIRPYGYSCARRLLRLSAATTVSLMFGSTKNLVSADLA